MPRGLLTPKVQQCALLDVRDSVESINRTSSTTELPGSWRTRVGYQWKISDRCATGFPSALYGGAGI